MATTLQLEEYKSNHPSNHEARLDQPVFLVTNNMELSNNFLDFCGYAIALIIALGNMMNWWDGIESNIPIKIVTGIKDAMRAKSYFYPEQNAEAESSMEVRTYLVVKIV